jgi:hypothetical protein
LVSFLLPLLIYHILIGQLYHILIGQLSSSSVHSSHSQWSAFFFPCSVITFSLVSFLLPMLNHHIPTCQLSSFPAHSSHSRWSAFLSLLIHHILIGQLSSSMLIHHILTCQLSSSLLNIHHILTG